MQPKKLRRWLLSLAALTALALLALNTLASISDRAPGSHGPILLEGGPGLALPSPTVAPREGEPQVLLVEHLVSGTPTGRQPPVAPQRSIRPVDPSSLEPLPGWQPLRIRTASTAPTASGASMASPDRRWAFVREHTPASLPDRIGIIGLEAWSGPRWIEVPGGLWVHDWVPEGSALLGTVSHCAEPLSEGRCGEAWRHELWSLDAKHATASVVADLQAWPDHLVVRGESTAVLLMHRGDVCCGIEVEGVPFVAVVDLDGGDVTSEIPLPDLVIGQRIEEREHGTFGTMRQAGLALDPEGRRLYVAHADESRVTVVDIEEQDVETFDFRPEQPPLSRLGSWLLGGLGSTAEAKGGLYFTRQIAVSADGSRLYISGTEDHTCPGQEYFGCRNGVPLGLQVVDTASMRVVHEEPGIGRFQVTPGGRWLLGGGAYWEDLEDGGTTEHGFGLKVLDLQTHEVVQHLWPGEPVVRLTVAPDGRHAYVVTYGANAVRSGSRATEPECREDCYRLALVDLHRGTMLAERELGPEIPGLASPGGRTSWW